MAKTVPTLIHTMSLPLDTHWRRATCKEVNCSNWREGFMTPVPKGGPIANYIEHVMNVGELPENKRHFYKTDDPDTLRAICSRAYAGQTDAETFQAIDSIARRLEGGDLLCFVFPPGQKCWQADQHVVQTGREAVFTRQMGEAYQDPKGGRSRIVAVGRELSIRPNDWHNDIIDNQTGLITLRERHL